ncbi:MAG: acetate--CoA ligase family protein [Gammaproteobacteria bacterium]|nr:acetate--CoA ligase family protein [Gammaproteobacteria bacterium]
MMQPDSRQKRDNLKRLLRPRHIAYIGGSQVTGPLAASQTAGFDGEIWVVNPVRDEIGGIQTCARIEDLPQAPDAALIALSPERSIEAVAALAEIGAGGAVCMAAGFAELGDSGADLQQQLQQAAGDLAVVGPNCMGILNLFDGAAVWGSGDHIEHPGNRGAAIISQSGAFLYGITNVEQGFPLGYAISTGNQAVIDMADCIEAVIDDERVRAIGIYLEGLDNGAALGQACWHALEKGIAVIAMKGGDTAAEAVAISHTSAMVVERDLWQAFSQRYGLVAVATPKALVEALKLLTIGGIPRGNRVSAITYSGGLNSLIVAQAPDFGLELNPPTDDNADKLRAQLPEVVPVANPLDLNLPWSSKTGISLQDGPQIADCLTGMAAEVADMAVMFLDVPRPDELGSDRDWYPSMEAMAKVNQQLDIPCAVAGILPEGLVPELRHHLIGLGIAPLLGFSDAMAALSVAARVGEIQRDKVGGERPVDLLTCLDNTKSDAGARMLDEAESKTELARYHLRTTDFCVVGPDQAANVAGEIGFPVALKLLSNRISHKAKMGGVRLSLDSETAVEAAVTDIIAAAKNHSDLRVDRLLVERMIEDPRSEYIIGIKHQPALGLALMIGRGGVSAEELNHHVTVLLPLIESDLIAAMADIGLAVSAPGYASMLEAIKAVAAYAMDNHRRLSSLDVNPVIVTAEGDAIAADGLIVLTEEK